MQGFTRPAGGEYRALPDIAKLTGDAVDVNVLDIWGNQAGHALVIWGDTGEDEGPRMLYGSYRQKADGPWGDPVMLSDEQSAYGGLSPAVVRCDGGCVSQRLRLGPVVRRPPSLHQVTR